MGPGGGDRGSGVRMEAADHYHAPPRRGILVVSVLECSWMHPTYRQEFRPQVRIAVVGTPPERGPRQRHDLAYAPHLRAEVMGFEVDGNPVRLEHRLQSIGDLLPDALLYSKALGKQAHEPGELGETDDVLMADTTHGGMSGQRQPMSA